MEKVYGEIWKQVIYLDSYYKKGLETVGDSKPFFIVPSLPPPTIIWRTTPFRLPYSREWSVGIWSW